MADANAEPRPRVNSKRAEASPKIVVSTEASPTKKKRLAAKGEGASPAKLSSMLGVLKYNSEHGKNEDKKRDAAEAIKIYRSLADPADRVSFLKEFELNGNGKGPSGLKFASTFKMKIEGGKTTEIGTTENFMTRPVRATTIRI